VEFSDSSDTARAWARTTDVLVVSHSLYVLGGLDAAIGIAGQLQPGALVVVRGLGPSSVFSAPFEVFGRAIWRPGVSHLWNSAILDELRSKAKLQPVTGAAAVERRDVNLDALGGRIDHGYVADYRSRHGFTGALNEMYGALVSETFDSQFRQQQAINDTLGRNDLIGSSDLVYFLEKR
jgi:hypothetical protein